MELMFAPLKRYFDFQGRSRRSEYWLFYLLTTLVTMALYLPLMAVGMDPETGEPGPMMGLIGLLLVLVWLGFFIPSLAVTIRRLHDTNRSGWWVLISFLPLAGALVLFIFMLLNGTVGPNRFGADPKGENSAEVFS
jgi:uncharacterized membrane protein YhaH (DUF805 family)